MNLQYPLRRKDPAYTKPVMSDREFLQNIVDTTRGGMERVAQAVKSEQWEKAREAYLQAFAETSSDRYFFGVNEVERLAQYILEHYDTSDIAPLLHEAERIAEGDFPIYYYGGKRIRFEPGAYDWNGSFYDSSQYQLYLVRFLYLTNVSRAYALTRDERYAQCVNDILDHFIDDCPVPLDGTFCLEHCTWDPLSVGVRMFTWPETLVTCFASSSFTDELKMKLIKSLYQHGEYVKRYHARHGNHACMELRGLAYVALLLPELKCAQEWLEYAVTGLTHHLLENVYEDGVQFEASPEYHTVVMRDAYEMIPLWRKLGISYDKALDVQLERMFEFLQHLMTPGGSVPRIGDTTSKTPQDYADIMSIGAAIYGRPDFKYFGGDRFPLGAIWKIGMEDVERFAQLVCEKPASTSAVFPSGGYLISRDDWNRNAGYMIMRAGVGIGGHAHADALSAIFFAFGKELLVDSGMGVYEFIPERKYLVSTKAHNTLVVDGQDQHTRTLHWGPQQSAACKLWDVRQTAKFDYFMASHYGYTRYMDPVVHTRSVLSVRGRFWLVIDRMTARDRHQYDQYWHLPPEEICASSDMREIRTTAEDANVMLLIPGDSGANVQLESGLLHRDGEYYNKPVVRCSQEATGDALFETIIVPYEGGASKPRVAVERVPVFAQGSELSRMKATGLQITINDVTVTVAVHHGAVDPQSFLDHTGNPIGSALLGNHLDQLVLNVRGQQRQSDVIVI